MTGPEGPESRRKDGWKMAKITGVLSNDFCPQALFLYGTCKEDGAPNFGLFSWFSYVWNEELGVMACIGEEKLTKDLIRKNRVFSANLVTEELLPLADYYGNTRGCDPGKMRFLPTVEWGKVLQVPTIAESPVSFELEVVQEIPLSAGSDMFLCRIRNVLIEEGLTDRETPFVQRLLRAAPVLSPGEENYVSIGGRALGRWGEPMNSLREKPAGV